jgi:hypothetical protein
MKGIDHTFSFSGIVSKIQRPLTEAVLWVR